MVKTRNNTSPDISPDISKDIDLTDEDNDDDIDLDNSNNNNNKISIEFNDNSNILNSACTFNASCLWCKSKSSSKSTSFKTINSWRIHHDSTHLMRYGYNCPINGCNKNSQNWYNYTNHVQTHNNINSSYAWNCILDHCNTSYPNIYSLLLHWEHNHKQYIINNIPSKSQLANKLNTRKRKYPKQEQKQKQIKKRKLNNKCNNNQINFIDLLLKAADYTEKQEENDIRKQLPVIVFDNESPDPKYVQNTSNLSISPIINNNNNNNEENLRNYAQLLGTSNTSSNKQLLLLMQQLRQKQQKQEQKQKHNNYKLYNKQNTLNIPSILTSVPHKNMIIATLLPQQITTIPFNNYNQTQFQLNNNNIIPLNINTLQPTTKTNIY